VIPATFLRAKPAQSARVGILGVPFESSSTFGTGTKFAPYYIRIAGENTVEYSNLQGINLLTEEVSDWGNVDVLHGNFEGTREEMLSDLEKMKEAGVKQFFIIGGEHSISPAVIEWLKPKRIAVIDAHLDFEEEWNGIKHSHACAVRRMAEIVGYDRIVVLGARSFSEAEKFEAEELGLRYYTSLEIREDPHILSRELAKADYLSVDLDGFDPSFAPEVGNPEPFGLDPTDFLLALRSAKIRNADLVEAAPSSATTPTASLALVLSREIIARMLKVETDPANH